MRLLAAFLAFLSGSAWLASFAQAQSQPSSQPVQIPDLIHSTRGFTLEILPPRAHHFNTEAPARIEVPGGGAKVAFKLKETRLAVALTPAIAGKALDVQVFVCDDAKTYCLRKKQVIALPASAPTVATLRKKRFPPEAPPRGPESGGKPARAHREPDTGFIVNDPGRAFGQASREKLPLIIDFFGIWCPPCNHLDAVVLRSAAFKKAVESKFVRLKIDADADGFAGLRVKYNVRFLPTVIFATPGGDEIFRVEGYHPPEEMIAKAQVAFKNRDEGYADLGAKASGGNAEARYKAALIALDRDEPEKALQWLKPLEPLFTATEDPRRPALYKAELGVAQKQGDKNRVREVLEKWVKEFPEAVPTVDNSGLLADLAEEAGEKDAAREWLGKAAALAAKLIADPTRLLGSEYTVGDMTQARAGYLERLGDAAGATAAYTACVNAFVQEAQAEGSGFARGPNLERAYCLGRSGRIQESEALFLEGIRKFPKEYTFHAGLARMWLDSGKDPRKAAHEADEALRYAYGSQRLKAVMTKASALEALGDFAAGAGAIDDALFSPPPEQATTNTVRLRKRLEEKRDALRKKANPSQSS